MKRSEKEFVIFMILLLVGVTLIYAAGSQERDAYASTFKIYTKSYGFPLRNISTYRPLTIDTANDVVFFKVKKNVEDANFVITKTCTYVKKFTHSGVTGTVSKGDSVTGATSGATGTIGYIDPYGDDVYMHTITGTFVDGEQVYETVDVNEFYLADYGVWLGVTSLSTSDTNLDTGDYFAYVILKNTAVTPPYEEILLKSKWKVIQ